MTIQRMDHVGIVVDDLAGAMAFSKEKPEPKDVEWLGQLRDLFLSRVDELHTSQEARTLVERRYLDGRGALFPDLASAWEEQVKGTETIAVMAVRLAELDGVGPNVPPDPEALSGRTAELVADLVRAGQGRGARQAR